MAYEALFSLGSNCGPAWQIRRFFKSKPGCCFDWIVTPVEAIGKIFADDGARFGLRASVCLRGTSVLCENYGVLYHHEFERGPQDRLIFTKEALEACHAKLQYKYNKMLQTARTHRTLFIRYISGTDVPDDPYFRKMFLNEDLEKLAILIENKIGHTDFHLAFVGSEGNPYNHTAFQEPLPPHCSIHTETFIPHRPGNDEAWDRFFAKMGFAPDSPPLL